LLCKGKKERLAREAAMVHIFSSLLEEKHSIYCGLRMIPPDISKYI